MDELAPSKRLELHDILEDLIDPHEVYHQPPSSFKLTYPCIIYELANIQTVYANSTKYKNKKRYTVTVIDTNPDSEIPNKVLELAYCSFDRKFKSDNLNHFVFTLYY